MSQQADTWLVKGSLGAVKTSNPIREIIETMNLAENPDKKLIPLSIGDPTIFGNLKPCQEILEALHRANSCGKHYGYQKAAGMEEARQAVAEYHYRSTGNRVKSHDIILASGCSHAIDLSICVLANPGQNILIPRPGFPLYKTLTSVYGVTYKQYNLVADNNWSIDLEHLESLIDENTAAIVINNPSNPCGSVFSKKHLMQILKLAERYRKPIISDEIYDKFVFSPEHYKGVPAAQSGLTTTTSGRSSSASLKFLSTNGTNGDSMAGSNANSNGLERKHSHNGVFQSSPTSRYQGSNLDGPLNGSSWLQISGDNFQNDTEQQEITDESHLMDEPQIVDYVPFRSLASLSQRVPILTCGGISKTCLIPGIRLGWIIINDKQNVFDITVRDGLSRLSQRLMGPNSLVQGALHDILTTVPETFYSQTMDFIFNNAMLCFQRLSRMAGLQPHMPQGSMYLMCRFEAESFPGIEDDLDFTTKLVNEESVLVLPGKCFDFPNYFRICLTVPRDVMVEALDRIESFCKRHKRLSDRVVSVVQSQTQMQPQKQISMRANSPMATLKSVSCVQRGQLVVAKDANRLKSMIQASSHQINCQQVSKCKCK